ncbi:glycosyltransferase family 2 protein [Cytophagaceae bacterium ABcell3]|nr:glycosyltransferase family 2 protein [Cytophagaceae bacterium ABcell3]
MGSPFYITNSPDMPEISVVIITYNEEGNIERCLKSVKAVADEIVVLDSFSTDRTEEICKKYGVKFFQHAFDGHIQQKNRAITYASYPHVLSLDADEALGETLTESILKVKKEWACDGYYMNRLTNYCGQWIRHSGWYPDRKLRLWDSRKGAWGGQNPHDKYELQTGCKTQVLKGDLLHYSYYSIEEHYAQVDKFSKIAAKVLYEEGKNVSLFFVYLKAVAKFIRNYFIKRGFLDGKMGFTVCRITAYETYLKYHRLRTMNRNR